MAHSLGNEALLRNYRLRYVICDWSEKSSLRLRLFLDTYAVIYHRATSFTSNVSR